MKVAYLSLFQILSSDGRYGRVHDILEVMDGLEIGFDYEVFPIIGGGHNPHLQRLGFEVDDLWGNRLSNLETLLSFRETVADITSYDPEIIHLLKPRPLEAALTAVVASRTGARVVAGPNMGGWYPVREDRFWGEGISGILSKKLNYRGNQASVTLSSPAVTFVFSEYHELMVRSLGVDSEQIEVLEPAVKDAFRPDDGVDTDIDLLYVGDLSKHKGYHVLLEVLERLDGQRSLRVGVAGGNPETTPEFETIDLEFHGFVPRDKLPALYNRAKLFLCLSTDEMGPNTLIEALACETPAVVNDEPGLEEYLRGSNGLLCDRTDLDDVVATIRKGLDDFETLERAAGNVAATYDISSTVQQLERVYSDICHH